MAGSTPLDDAPGTPMSGSPSEGPRTPGPSRRVGAGVRRRGLKRSSAACQRCRKRKQKCDGKTPVCGPCTSAAALCVPSDRLVIRSDRDDECNQLRAQLHQLQEHNERLQDQLHHVQREQPLGNTEGLGVGGTAQVQTSTDVGTDYRGRILRPTFPRLNTQHTNDSSFLWSPWRLWDGLTVAQSPETRSVHLQNLSDKVRLDLVNTFFNRRWPQFPVLHRPSFMATHYEPLLHDESPTNKLSPFIVNIVFAIAAWEQEQASSSVQAMHQAFFQTAIDHLGEVLGADDLDCIQCLLLLCIYGSNEPQVVNLWHTAGLTLRLAIGVDLHRRESLAKMGFLEAEMAKRLFWSVYNMDRSISISMGRPLGIQDSDITTPQPLCLTDDSLVAQNQASNNGQITPNLTGLVPDPRDLSTFIHIVQLRRVNADIYRTLHSASETDLTIISITALRSQFYGQLNHWLVSAPRYIHPGCMNQTPEWFQIAYHQAILNLYRPSHASHLLGAVSVDDIRLCADSSISLITNYSALHAKNRISYTYVALTSLFMAAVTMLYSVRASAALRTELTRDVVNSNIRMCIALLKVMANGRPVGDRSAQIISRLGSATLAVFDAHQAESATGANEVEVLPEAVMMSENGDSSTRAVPEVDTEFLSWFGLKTRHLVEQPGPGQPTPSVDMAWNDLFDNGFDFSSLYCNDVLF